MDVRSLLKFVLFFTISLSAMVPSSAALTDFRNNSPAAAMVKQLLGVFDGTTDATQDGRFDIADAVYASFGTPLLRLNAGGPTRVDASGRTWFSDEGLGLHGNAVINGGEVQGTVLDDVYGSQRVQAEGQPPLEFRIGLEPGVYQLRLHFAEMAGAAPGTRVFDIFAENDLLLGGIDISGAVGFANAVQLDVLAKVFDGELNLQLVSRQGLASINALEVFRFEHSDEGRPVVARLNAGAGSDYTDNFGRVWSGDEPFSFGGAPFFSPDPIGGSSFPAIYQTERFDPAGGPNLSYAFSVPPGVYSVRLHFAELFNFAPGIRFFSVAIEGQTVLNSFDILGLALRNTSLVREFTMPVLDGTLNIEFFTLSSLEGGEPKVNGIEVIDRGPVALSIDPLLVQWSNRPMHLLGERKNIRLTNNSDVAIPLEQVRILTERGSARNFILYINGVAYPGALGTVEYSTPFFVPARGHLDIPVVFTANTFGENLAFVEFRGLHGVVGTALAGDAGIGGETQNPFVSAIVEGPSTVVDVDGDGVETITFRGDASRSFLPGGQIIGWEWYHPEGFVFATGPVGQGTFPVGTHTITLSVADNYGNQRFAPFTFTVGSLTDLPGVLARYYKNRTGGPEFLLNGVPATADFAEIKPTFEVTAEGETIGSSPFTVGVMTRLQGKIPITAPGRYNFLAIGGFERRLLVNGAVVNGPVQLGVGQAEIDARFAINTPVEMPIQLLFGGENEELRPVNPSQVSHSQAGLVPTINTLPGRGNANGGEAVRITGLGFFPAGSVEVHWGPNLILADRLTVTDTTIDLLTPQGVGLVQVFVKTPNGESNRVPFQYTDPNAAPISFSLKNTVQMSNPTRGAWGPDGRLYVTGLNGLIKAILYDDNYNVVNVQDITAIQGLSNNTILGITTNPFDPPDPVRIYVAHSKLYAHGGSCFNEFSPYNGQISVLTGPNFNVVEPLITGLPVSNHDHAINALEFDHNGDLLICVGGNTNAGVGACPIGGLDESPLSAAILRAFTSKPDFNGAITYIETGTTTVNMDQRAGGYVDVAPGVDIEVFAYGLRNSFDMILTTSGRIYATDNGANAGFGPISTGPFTFEPEYSVLDELELIEYKNYYGHPNRNLGRYDNRLNFWYPPSQATIPGVYTGPLATSKASTNGILEYTAQTFGGAMRGEILTQVWNGEVIRYRLSGDGRSVTSTNNFPANIKSLDILTGPGGAVVGIDFSSNLVRIALPNDPGTFGPTIFDVHPWRASTAGGTLITIGGQNFGSIENTSVTIGGVAAPVEYVSSNRIRARVPARPGAPEELLSIEVTTNGTTVSYSTAFRYIGDTRPDTGARAFLEIDPFGSILGSSTYNNNSFRIFNNSTGGQQITRVTYDLTTAILPDMVFDPFADAGDTVGKPFSINSNNGVGSATPQYLGFRDGGYDILQVDFTSFDPGNDIGFSIDVDPTSINGTSPPGPGESGSISGLELVGTTIRVEFSDGTIYIVEPYRKPGSLTGAKNNAKPNLPPAPTIEIIGIGTTDAFTNEPNHVIRVTGAGPGTPVSLLHLESALFVQGAGFDVQPFESNTVLNVEEYFAAIGDGGFVDIPVVLRKTQNAGGYNVFTAVFKDDVGDNGEISQTLVLKFD